MGEGATRSRISVAKGAILSLLDQAYLNRDKVCLITFRDDEADIVLPPTGSIDLARKSLHRLAIGGSSPLAKGLNRGGVVMQSENRRDTPGRPILVLISDGEANAPISKGVDPADEVLALCRTISTDEIPALVIDTGATGRNDLMQQVAEQFRTVCHRVTHLQSSTIIEMVESIEG